MSRYEQTVGKHGQKQAASHLDGLGFMLVEEIGTPVTTLQVKAPGLMHRKDIFRVIYGKKVSGDHRATLPDGSSVLIETKTIYGRNLAYGDMRPHQPERLSLHAAVGLALSLLVWVSDSGIFVMRWKPDGIDGFGHRKSITVARARVLDAEFMDYFNKRLALTEKVIALGEVCNA